MYRIFVNDSIWKHANDFAEKMIKKNRVKVLWELYNTIKFPNKTSVPIEVQTQLLDRYREYIKRIIFHYDELFTLRYGLFSVYERTFFNIGLKEEDFSKILISESGKSRPFYMHIVEAMDYTDARNIMLNYVEQMHIRCCPYCNICPAETIDINDEEKIGRYQLDHFMDKHKYAFLCTSFFNLVPSCAYCNGKKTDGKILFYLYSGNKFLYENFDNEEVVETGPDLDSFFHFSFPNGFSKYALNQIKENIEFKFDIDTDLQKSHNNTFFIQKLYEKHKDEISIIINKIIDYLDENIEVLKTSHPKLEFSSARKKETIFGPYLKNEEIHERAYTKLTIDIANYFQVL